MTKATMLQMAASSCPSPQAGIPLIFNPCFVTQNAVVGGSLGEDIPICFIVGTDQIAIARQLSAQRVHAVTQSSIPPTRPQSLAHSVQITAHSSQTCAW